MRRHRRRWRRSPSPGQPALQSGRRRPPPATPGELAARTATVCRQQMVSSSAHGARATTRRVAQLRLL